MQQLRPTPKEQFLSKRQRYHPIALLDEFSDEELARDWTLTRADIEFLAPINRRYRVLNAIQLCSIRLYGRFLDDVDQVAPKIATYLAQQLTLPASLTVNVPARAATTVEHRQAILRYLGYRRFDDSTNAALEAWLKRETRSGDLLELLYERAERHLLEQRIVLPGASILERLVWRVSANADEPVFQSINDRLSPELRQRIDTVLNAPDGGQASYFHRLKEYPPAASANSLKQYLERYATLTEIPFDEFDDQWIEPASLEYLFDLARRYNARDMKRFKDQKRYALAATFLGESRKILLDHLAKMHDQYMMGLCRKSKNIYEQRLRLLRKRQGRAIGTALKAIDTLLDWPTDEPLYLKTLWQRIDEKALRESREDLAEFRRLESRGFGDLLLARYPTMRKYFADFIQLPFAAAHGSEALLAGIELVRQLDSGELKGLPEDAPTSFIPHELRRALKDRTGKLNRNAWEMGLALGMKEALRSGDLFVPQSKQHVSFSRFMLNDERWTENREIAYSELGKPKPELALSHLIDNFNRTVAKAEQRFPLDRYAEIVNGKLKLKRDEAAQYTVDSRLQKAIDANMPHIRIEQLLMEVDAATGFTRHFAPLQRDQSRPANFYRVLLATIISQATNLGVVAMSESVAGMSINMLRHVLKHYIREKTLTGANAEIVNHHHQLSLSAVHGSGEFSSSDGQRFKIRADSLLGGYYPRYFGYYDQAIGLYTHVSDQASAFSTRAISPAPREALYVLDGLLGNNTILKIRSHTTDTDGYTDIQYGLLYLLGYDFVPRIKNLKDKQLYRVEKGCNDSLFAPLLTKVADANLVAEQWDTMMRLGWSLKLRTAPAHVVMERLTNSFPADRLSKAITNLGRILRTQDTLWCITDPYTRRGRTRQLNKGEERQGLCRWVFFGNQGEFDTGDYVEIMNKASCLSLVSNAILYWNTVKISEIVDQLRQQGETIDDEELAHISPLRFRHVRAHGTYFIDEK